MMQLGTRLNGLWCAIGGPSTVYLDKNRVLLFIISVCCITSVCHSRCPSFGKHYFHLESNRPDMGFCRMRGLILLNVVDGISPTVLASKCASPCHVHHAAASGVSRRALANATVWVLILKNQPSLSRWQRPNFAIRHNDAWSQG
jgi:hypothetical protein